MKNCLKREVIIQGVAIVSNVGAPIKYSRLPESPPLMDKLVDLESRRVYSGARAEVADDSVA